MVVYLFHPVKLQFMYMSVQTRIMHGVKTKSQDIHYTITKQTNTIK